MNEIKLVSVVKAERERLLQDRRRHGCRRPAHRNGRYAHPCALATLVRPVHRIYSESCKSRSLPAWRS